MKSLIIFCTLIGLTTLNVQAQKFAYVDSDYILERIPEYGSAQDQLEKLSLNWQSEIEEIYQQKLHRNLYKTRTSHPVYLPEFQ